MEDFISSFVSPQCATTLFSDSQCMSLLISKLLGTAIIAGSLIIKVPQIIKILGAKSAKGINFASVILELVGLLFTLAYSYRKGFPFSTYGETAFISVQNFVILYLIFAYGQDVGFSQLITTFVIYFTTAFLFLVNPGDLVPETFLASLQALNIPILIAARIPQIWTNYKAKSAGQLALLTWILNFAGVVARVFTTLKEVNDPIVLIGYLIAVVLNGTILSQILYYGSSPTGKSVPAVSSPTQGTRKARKVE